MSRLGVLDEIAGERRRQDERWGEQNHRCIDREIWPRENCIQGELVAKMLVRLAVEEHRLTWRHILDEEIAEAYSTGTTAELRAELVQCAAVIVAWIECIDRNKVGEEA